MTKGSRDRPLYMVHDARGTSLIRLIRARIALDCARAVVENQRTSHRISLLQLLPLHLSCQSIAYEAFDALHSDLLIVVHIKRTVARNIEQDQLVAIDGGELAQLVGDAACRGSAVAWHRPACLPQH